MAAKPGDDFRPDLGIGLAPDQNSQVLKADAEFAGIDDQPHIAMWERIQERRDRLLGRDLVGRVDDREQWPLQIRWTDDPAADRQGPSAEPVLAIEPLQDLADQRP